MKTVIKKLLKYKTLIILYEITTDTSTVYLSIIDNETKDTNRKHIKYNKGLVVQRTNQSYYYMLMVRTLYQRTNATRQDKKVQMIQSTVQCQQNKKWYNITVNKKRLNKKCFKDKNVTPLRSKGNKLYT